MRLPGSPPTSSLRARRQCCLLWSQRRALVPGSPRRSVKNTFLLKHYRRDHKAHNSDLRWGGNMSSTGQETPYSRQCATTRSMEWSRPSGGGNGGRRTSVVHRPIGSLPPAPRKVAPAGSHRWSFLLQMDPQGPSSDLISALKKSPVQEHGCTFNGGFFWRREIFK